MQNHLKIVVTGGVDSGKSTLIGRLLYETGSLPQGAIEEIIDDCKILDTEFEFAYLLDSLEEERRDRLTIDTTQVFLRSKRDKEFIFIDVPGHHELLKNMLCGSSYADIAVLVIDANKSLSEQAKRHVFILKFLEIEQIILALNKMDTIGFNKSVFEKNREKISEWFKKIAIQPKYFIPISAKYGDNLLKRSKRMPWFKGLPLIEALNHCLKKEKNCFFRFPIQDIYKINGEKVAIGKIASGKIESGEKVKILPFEKEHEIKEIRIFERRKCIAKFPESIGLLLNNMNGLRRGQIICKPKLPRVISEIIAKVFCIHPLYIKKNIKFKCATQEATAQIKKIMGIWNTTNLEPVVNKDALEETKIAKVIIITETPVVVENFKESVTLGRFVLQDNKEIYGVGIIL